MPALEERTVSFQEGSVSTATGASTSQASGQEEWLPSDEEPSIASIAFRGEIFALHAAPSLADPGHTPPKTIAEGMQDPDRKAALLREFDGHIDRKTFRIVDRPPGSVPIMQSFMLQSNKHDEKGDLKLCKARHVVDGRGQSKYPYDIDTYAPNLQKESFRFLCWVAAQCKLAMEGGDVVQAFTLPTLDSNEVYFCWPPKGFDLLCKERGIPFKKGQVLQLLAALYGLKNASHYWNTEFTQWLVKFLELEQCVNDPCLFVSFKRMLFVGIHTDDALVVGRDASLQHFKKEFDKRFPVKFLGFPKLWCGLQMDRFHDGSIKVSMETFTKKLLEKFWQGKINPSFSPLGLDKLHDDDPPDTETYPVRPAIGNFIWLVINLRFDIAPAVNYIARRQTKPSAKLVKFIKRVFRYLSATTDFALVYKSVPPARVKLQCSSDSSFDVDTMGGYAWFLGDSLISWKVVTAKCAVTSTCEAELFFLCAAAKTGVWLINFLKETMPSVLKHDVIIYNDNRAAIDIVNAGKFSQKTRHMATKCNYVHQQVKNGLFKVEWRDTQSLRADLLTKGFHPESFRAKLKLFRSAISLTLLEKS